MAKATSPASAFPFDHIQTRRPVRPPCSTTKSRFWTTATLMKRVQVITAARRQAFITPAKRASSRASAPKAFTVGLEEMASASAAPIWESRALERRLAGRT